MNQRLVLVAIALAAIAAFFVFDLDAYLQLDYVKRQQAALAQLVEARPALSVAAYFAVYVLVTALSLPGAAVLTLVGGGLFGLAWGTLIVSFASTLGATLAFLISRYLFRDAVAHRFGKRMQAIDAGVARDGAFYLFTLRLVPVFPFFVINLVMGLTAIRAPTFALVSQIGMLPGTLVFVNAGTQLAQLASPSDVLSPGLIGSFVLLGLFPLLAKRIVGMLQSRRIMRGYAKPKRLDRKSVV